MRYDDFVYQEYWNDCAELLGVAKLGVRRMVRGERAMYADDQIATVRSGNYRCFDRTYARGVDLGLSVEFNAFDAMTAEIGEKPICCLLKPLLANDRLFTSNQVAKEACPEVPIEKSVLEPIPEAA